MSYRLTVFFLCAGYGKRLNPLTLRTPKPLLPFQGQSLLSINFQQVMDFLRTQTELFSSIRVICNAHYLPKQISEEAKNLGIEVLHEENVLGTGGALWNAQNILRKGDLILTHNGDLLHQFDLAKLFQQHIENDHIGTLASIFHSSINTLSVSKNNELLGVHHYHEFDHQAELTRRTFAGVALYDQHILDYCPNEGTSDIKAWWTQAMRAQESFYLQNFSGQAWFDIGTPLGLWEAARWYMERVSCWNYNYVPSSNAQQLACVSNEAKILGLPAGLENMLIMETPQMFPAPGTKDRIIGEDFEWMVG